MRGDTRLRIGRLNLNKRLNLDVPESEYFLLPQDVLAAVDYLIKTKFGTGTLDDIDHLKNRHIRLFVVVGCRGHIIMWVSLLCFEPQEGALHVERLDFSDHHWFDAEVY